MTSDTSPSSTSDFATGVGIQPPELSKKGKVTRSAIKDSDQAWQIYCSLENDNCTCTSINAKIVARHTGKPARVGQIPGSALNISNWGGDTTPNAGGSFDGWNRDAWGVIPQGQAPGVYRLSITKESVTFRFLILWLILISSPAVLITFNNSANPKDLCRYS